MKRLAFLIQFQYLRSAATTHPWLSILEKVPEFSSALGNPTPQRDTWLFNISERHLSSEIKDRRKERDMQRGGRNDNSTCPSLSPQLYGTRAPLKLLLNCHILVVSHRKNSESSPCAVDRAAWKLAQALYFTPADWETQRSSVLPYSPPYNTQTAAGQPALPPLWRPTGSSTTADFTGCLNEAKSGTISLLCDSEKHVLVMLFNEKD